MQAFLDFLALVNQSLHRAGLPRLEAMMMPANFSTMVSEFLGANLPKHCRGLVKNGYHNGHPDLLPRGSHPSDASRHHPHGIEVKASRYTGSWQGHNAERVWLMVFTFDASRPTDTAKKVPPRPFRFTGVYGAQLQKADWTFAGRSAKSRRTITATVNKKGRLKMRANWAYAPR